MISPQQPVGTGRHRDEHHHRDAYPERVSARGPAGVLVHLFEPVRVFFSHGGLPRVASSHSATGRAILGCLSRKYTSAFFSAVSSCFDIPDLQRV